MPSSEEIETIAEEELKSGKEGLLMVPFHANPEPTNLTWYLADLKYPLGLNETSDRFTSRGWQSYVSRRILKLSSTFLPSESQHESEQSKKPIRGAARDQQAEGEGLRHSPQYLHFQ